VREKNVHSVVRITRNTQTRCGAKRAVFNIEERICIAKPINLLLGTED